METTPQTFRDLEVQVCKWTEDLDYMGVVFKNQLEELNRIFEETNAEIDKIEKIYIRLNCIKYFYTQLEEDVCFLKDAQAKIEKILPKYEINDDCDQYDDPNREFYKYADVAFTEYNECYTKFACTYLECSKADKDISKNKTENLARTMMKLLLKLNGAESKLIKLSEKTSQIDGKLIKHWKKLEDTHHHKSKDKKKSE